MADGQNPTPTNPSYYELLAQFETASSAFGGEGSIYGRLKFFENTSSKKPIEGLPMSSGQLIKILRSI